MMRLGIDEYTVTGTFDALNGVGNTLVAICTLSVLAAFILAIAAFDSKKRVRRISYTAVAAALVATAVTTGVLSSGPDFTQEVAEERTYLVATGTPVWSDTVRADGRIDELLIRLDSAEEWLLEFQGSDIDELIGRTGDIEAQCRVVSDEKMRCTADVTGPPVKGFWFIRESERTWGEPTIAPYQR